MKTLMRGVLATASVFAFAGVAQAQVSPVNEYLNLVPGQPTGNNNAASCANPGGNPNCTPATFDAHFAISGSVQGNTQAATPVVTSVYTLTGNVTPDCSFYGQGNRNINLGTLGVRTGNNEAVGNMFNLRSAAQVNISTTAAGCNTANTVTITKSNADGLINASTTSFDSAQFQNNLPYAVKASYTAPLTGTTGSQAGGERTIDISSTGLSGTYTTGAWRSGFNMNVETVVPTKGLISGNYEGTVTVTLAAAL